ncbi:MAG TPA: prepilin-type N-terminal cleavage/methylation domain-containing protein [Fimbriimonas sp.]|nr:prepilin-type N-terminal cleavage/methylation domain-containing protein [Fimbriimonas sp.]
MRARRGFTLVELMVVLLAMSMILAASASVVREAIQHTERVKDSRVISERDALFEDRIRSIVRAAYLSTDQTDASSYFIGGEDVDNEVSGNIGGGTQLIFTALTSKLPADLIQSGDDFETLNEQRGPLGGVTEISISLTPVGNAPVSDGMFLRKQTPADGDPSQGGYESVLDPDIRTIGLEFFDGTDWVEEWNTQQSNTPRLPSAVRILYSREGDNQDHYIVVHLPHSDVTPDNPVIVGDTE